MHLRSAFCLLVLGSAPFAAAAPVTNWVSIFDPQNNTPRFDGGSAATDSPVTTHADQDSIAANFPSVTLADGDSITLSGTVSIDVSLAGGNFRIGLFSGPTVQQDVGNPYVGLYSEAPTGSATGLKYGNGTHSDHAFGSGTVVSSGFLPGGAGVAANTPIDFSLTITRDGANLDVTSSYTDNGSYNRSGSVDNLPILNTAPGFTYTFNTAGFLFGGSMNGNQGTFSNIAVTPSAPAPDTDGDGLPDSYEQTIIDANGGDAVDGFEDVMGTGASPAVTDFDADGADDGEEYTEGTDPLDEDSDDDGFHDGAETDDGTFNFYDYTTNTGDTGTDPLNSDTDGDGLLDGVESDTETFVNAGDTGTDPLDADSDDDGTADGMEVTDGTDPNDAASNLTDHILGIEFNRNDAFGSPSQSLFRIISGSTSQGANPSSYSKTVGPYQVTVSQPDATAFEFRGANTDSSRAIPGGDTSLSFLVADFIATREGAIDIDITGLPAGDYVFRSYHLEPFTSSALGFAQGATTTTPNNIEARIGGVLKDSVQPTALGSAGLGTTFINDSQIPTIGFSFNHDGSSPLTIELRSTETNGTSSFLLLNGFELFQMNP